MSVPGRLAHMAVPTAPSSAKPFADVKPD